MFQYERGPAALGLCFTFSLTFGIAGCGSEGSGSIKIEPGARERALNPGGETAKPATAKQAKAKEAENAAAKKNSKLY